jgi:hypothetical protein
MLFRSALQALFSGINQIESIRMDVPWFACLCSPDCSRLPANLAAGHRFGFASVRVNEFFFVRSGWRLTV